MNTNVSVSTRNAPTELITVGETTYAYHLEDAARRLAGVGNMLETPPSGATSKDDRAA